MPHGLDGLDPDTIVIALGPGGGHGPDTLGVRVDIRAAPEVMQLLNQERIYAGPGITASASPQELAMVIGSIAGGLHGIATVMRAFFNRNQHRSVTFIVDNVPYEMKGMSQKDAEALVTRAVESSAQAQKEAEPIYRKHLPGYGDHQD